VGPTINAAGYAELHCWSNFTFLQGGSHPEELVERAVELGLGALALTDRDGLYGTVRFAAHARTLGLAAIVGSELTFEDGTRIVLLVEDRRGYTHLCDLISAAQMRGRKGDARLRIDDLEGRTGGLIALSGGSFGRVERALAEDRTRALAEARHLHALFAGDFYIELQQHLTAEETRRNLQLVQLAHDAGVDLVATNGAAYARKEHAPLADALNCVKHKTNLEQARTDYRLRANTEYYLKSAAQMRRLFSAYPAAVDRSVELARRCAFRLERLTGQFPLFPVPGEKTPQTYLRELVYAGAAGRYPLPLAPRVVQQLEHELAVIAKMGLAGYFLIVWDIVRAAHELKVLCQGRGSAANSAVCYALGITAVDPIGMELLFERFMSEERDEIPDIDIDFAHQDRERVIQYVYDRYGRANAAMVAEVITYHARSALRDLGKALGLSLEQVDAVAREVDARESLAGAMGVAEPKQAGDLPAAVEKRRDLDAASNVRRSREETWYAAGFTGQDVAKNPGPLESSPIPAEIGARLYALCRRIDGFPRHLGIHSGGMVITRDPLVCVAPVEWATMRDRTVIQWDKDDLADLGLIKIDLLGLGMLSLLREAFSLHERLHGTALALHTIPADDPPTYAMISRADTIGVFQIESRAQQSMLPRMQPRKFYDIVMQVAIVRPGPIQGQMVHPFLRRRAGLEPVTYPHEKLRPVLERTMGVPLFQEQGMRLAIVGAGFTPGEADQLRRAMGHKRSRARMREIYPRIVQGMVDNGIDREAADNLFHMLEGFSDYGFPESHAASFALLAYASAYVKCHHPAIFAAAILNVQPMGFYSTEVLVNDARRHNVVVRPVTVNASEYWSFVEPDGALRLGFHLIRGLGEAQRKRLEAALGGGRFADLVGFARRTQLGKDALENLAVAGAFAPWFSSRRTAMWELRGLDEREARGALGRLMDVDEDDVTLRALGPKEKTAFDLWSTGVTPHGQMIEHFRPLLDRRRVVPAARLCDVPASTICRVAGLVITRQRPGTAKGFVFLTLEDETGLVNVIVRPKVYERNRRAIRQAATLVIEGRLQKEAGCIDLIAQRFWQFDDGGVGEGIHARNFH
jgi:error-prone DNA polymerase